MVLIRLVCASIPLALTRIEENKSITNPLTPPPPSVIAYFIIPSLRSTFLDRFVVVNFVFLEGPSLPFTTVLPSKLSMPFDRHTSAATCRSVACFDERHRGAPRVSPQGASNSA